MLHVVLHVMPCYAVVHRGGPCYVTWCAMLCGMVRHVVYMCVCMYVGIVVRHVV